MKHKFLVWLLKRVAESDFYYNVIKSCCFILLIKQRLCDKNGLDGVHHLGVIQLNLVFIIFIVLCDMDESSSRFGMPKTFDEEKECVINSVPKSTVYLEQMAITDFKVNYKFYKLQ